MAFSPDTTVGEIAGRFPGTIRVFQRFGIEFCCGGRRTLAGACRDAGISYGEFAAELASALTTSHRHNWSDRPIGELTTHIVESFHEPLRQELPRLHEMALRLEGHASWPGHAVSAVRHELARFRSELEAHITEEEEMLFPLIERLEVGAAHAGDEALLLELRTAFEVDHVVAGRSLRALRELTENYQAPTNACPTMRGLYHGLEELEALMHLHVHMENNVLFPRAATLVGAAAYERL
jgi:regulator of cell morphogenesis and NO signaling